MGNIGGMTEGIVLSLLFVVLITAVLAHFNATYDQSNSVGLDPSGLDAFNSYADSAEGELGGEVTQTSDGLTLTSSWTIAKGLFSTVWGFINGSFIQTLIIDIFHVQGATGAKVAGVLRLLFVCLLIFGIIKLFFKVSP